MHRYLRIQFIVFLTIVATAFHYEALAQCTATISSSGTQVCTAGVGVYATFTGTSYTWYKNGTLMSGQTASSITVSPGSGTAGYYCVATISGCSGTRTSNTVNITDLKPVAAISPSGPTIACPGTPGVVLTAQTATGNTYQWMKNGTIITGQTSSTYTAPNAGTYYCVVTKSGCYANSNTIAITDPTWSLPTVAASGPICNGNSVTVNSTNLPPASFYSWYKNGSAVTSGGTYSPYTATTVGTYKLFTVTNGCTGYSNEITVSDATPVASISGMGVLCAGQSTTLSAQTGTGYLYQWFKNGTIISGATASSYSASEVASYYVVVTLGGCSKTSNTMNVTANNYSTTITASGNACNGGTVTFTGPNGMSNYVWYRNGTYLATTTVPTYSAATQGNYYCLLVNGSCTSNSNTVSVPGGTTPTATLTVNGSTTLCSGDSVQLSANTIPGATYKWFKSGVQIANATLSSIYVKQNGIYTFEITDNAGGGCAKTATSVSISSGTVPTATISGPTSICNGSSATLTASAGTGYTYQWIRNDTLISGATNATYVATKAASYKVKVTNATGCFAISSPTTISITPPPIATITGASFVCEGSNTILTASTGAGYTYQWIKNDTLVSGATNSTITITGGGSYKVKVTNSSGCFATSNPLTVVKRSIVLTVLGNTDFCHGDSTLLTATSDAGYLFQWLKNGVAIGGATSSTYYVKSSGSYTVQVTANSCQKISTAKVVNELPLPTATIQQPNSTIVCQGIAIPLQATTGLGYTFQWKKNNQVIAGATNSLYNVTTSGSYRVVVTKGNCVSVSDTIPITKRQLPTVAIEGKRYFCNDDSTTLHFEKINGYTYQWIKDKHAVAGNVSGDLTVSNSAYIQVLISDGLCSDTTASAIITELPIPHTVVGLQGDSLLWTGQRELYSVVDTTHADGFSWKVPATATISYTDPKQSKVQISFSKPGKHSISVYSHNGGCWSGAFTELITVDGNSMADNKIPEQVKTSRDKKLTLQEPTIPKMLADVDQNQSYNVFDAGCMEGKYFVGFQLQYDLGDRNTTKDWSVFLQISLLHEDDTVWIKPLQVDMNSQTFIATIFHDSVISCTEDYRFVVKRKYLSGDVPDENVYLNTLLFKQPENNFNAALLPVMLCDTIVANIKEGHHVSWTYAGNGVQEYDLEWVFIGDFEQFNGTTGESAFQYKEPVGVTVVNSTNYKHSVFYPDGNIWYRIRAVGYNPLYPEHRILGDWAYNNCSKLNVTNPERTRNWQEQTVFAEEGKYKTVLNYFDGSLRQRQAETNLSTESVTVVGEMRYDFEGRQSLNMLAVPSTSNSLKYHSGFNNFTTADTVIANRTGAGRNKFHYDNYRVTNSIVSTASGAGQYYSSANQSSSIHKELIPDGEGYVYSQTEYLNDGTGRITRQSGVGKAFAQDGDHATKYYYGEPTPAELIRLFGSNVGAASHYKKNLVVDANGQVSVSYLDQEGKTIATALAGDPPANVDSLASFKALMPIQAITNDVSSKNIKSKGQSILSHKILNESPNSIYSFNYDLSAYASQISMFGCKTCVFDLKLTIADPDGRLLSFKSINGNQGIDTLTYERKNISAASCDTATTINDIAFSMLFKEIGDFTVTKTLTVHELSYNEIKSIVEQDETVQRAYSLVRNSYTVNPEDCEVCTSGPEAEKAIEDAIDEVAQMDCENIYNQIVQYYKDRNDGGEEPYEVPQDSIEHHELYCKYLLCAKDKESDIFEKRFSRIKSWSDAVGSNSSNLFSIDPFFQNASLSGYPQKSSMQSKLNDVFVAKIGYDINGDKLADGYTEFRGPIAVVTDPTNTAFFIDEDGAPDPVNGRHILYIDIENKRAQSGEASYHQQINEARWNLYKGFYLEAKRKVKIDAYADCPKAIENLKVSDGLPSHPDSVRIWAKVNGLTDSVSTNELETSLLSIRNACHSKFSKPDSTTISNHLKAYFNGNRNNFLNLIFTGDLHRNPHLIAIQNVLNNYNCGLDKVAMVDPLSCSRDTLITVVNKFLPATGVQSESFSERTSIQQAAISKSSRMSSFNNIEALDSTLNAQVLADIRGSYTETETMELSRNSMSKNAKLMTLSMATPSQSEYDALLALYNSTTGGGWFDNSGWVTANAGAPQDVSTWAGVTTDANGHVIGLDLHGNRLVGSIPSSIGALTYLKTLNLWANGNLIGSVPSQINQLVNLETLNLGATSISALTTTVNGLTGLKYLGLDQCPLLTNLSIQTGSMPNLLSLSAIDCPVLTSLPVTIGSLANLRELDMTRNKLSSIPASINNLGKLQVLKFWNLANHLDLPYIGNLDSLRILDFGGNGLTQFPQGITNLTKLQILDLAGSNFSDSIPDDIGNLKNLQSLNISNSSLDGTLPEGLGELESLVYVYLGDNEIKGGIPSSLGNLKKVAFLSLKSNHLEGSIPATLGEIKGLRSLDLSNNLLSDSIPSKLGDLTNAYNFTFGNNRLSGEIPKSFGNLHLEWLALNDNQLTGNIPSELNNIHELNYLTLNNNKMGGPLPSLDNLNLYEFDISSNKFYGLLNFQPEYGSYTNILDNKFTFSDVIPFYHSGYYDMYECGGENNGPCFYYFRQDSVDVLKNVELIPGTPLALTTDIDRSTNPSCKFQWFKYVDGVNDVAVTSLDTASHTFTIQNTTPDDVGMYYYRISNDFDPSNDLVLTSRLQTVLINDGLKSYNICLSYDTSNATIRKYSYTVDWNKVAAECLANAVKEDSILSELAVELLTEDYVTEYRTKYQTQCLDKVKEHFKYTHDSKEYHYTLYYYDQAKNLVQTVPPSGVKPLTPTQVTAFMNGTKTEPQHNLLTRYEFSSLNQLVWQKTPDAGESNFYYNAKGQLKLSQNAQQFKDSKYSYTKYDNLSRIVEVGELETSSTNGELLDSLESTSFPMAGTGDIVLFDVTRTHYDFADASRQGKFVQKYLRSRVSWVEVFDKGATDTIATYYTYDVHGNVKSLVQCVPGLQDKRTDYVYDLVSGKVNYVFYQYGKNDQFSHKYSYDSDNRLTEVHTSTDRFIWNKDAAYYYYQHGPLARVELGAYRSQGQDYFYTLQGWIKGVNQPYKDDPDLGNGYDYNVGKDAYAYALGYYQNDYKAINPAFTPTDTRDHLWTRLNETLPTGRNGVIHSGLYNGNISWMVTDLAKLGEVKNDRAKGMQAMLYKYDQLNRITKSRGLTNYSESGGFAVKSNAAYDETYSYDGNGNILMLDRMNGAGQSLHNYDYYYYKNSNKLRGVLPIVRDTTYDATINSNNKLYRDILVESTARPQIGIHSELRATRNITIENNFEAEEGNDFAAYIPEDGPFVYNAAGNLIADQEKGSKISWLPNGKVKMVTLKNDSVKIFYRYNATGNRIEKRVEYFDTLIVTRYIHEANGNVMAVYSDSSVAETMIYGGSRTGIYTGNSSEGALSLGNRKYELKNHLGSANAIISDNIGMNSSDSVWSITTALNDYYPFGLGMKEREWQKPNLTYRYKFQKQEFDEETNTYSYEYRTHDPTIGRFWSIDPLTKKYPFYSPYSFSGNRVIDAVELEGLEPSKNPKKPNIYSKELITKIVIGAFQNHNEQNGKVDKDGNSRWEGLKIKGHYEFQGNSTFLKKTFEEGLSYTSDSDVESANRYNHWVTNEATFIVDESQAGEFKDYEAFTVASLMKNFLEGTGPENYVFPENGIISRKFLNSDLLNKAKNDFKNGWDGKPKEYRFTFGDLVSDTWRNGNLYNITGLVGSGTISITANEYGIKIVIYNITSLTSGTFGKEVLPSKDMYPKSFVRTQDSLVPLGNISQTFQLSLDYNEF